MCHARSFLSHTHKCDITYSELAQLFEMYYFLMGGCYLSPAGVCPVPSVEPPLQV